MKIDAKVQSISKLKDYFFLVPDYQREYVWKPDDEVEQLCCLCVFSEIY